MRGASDREKGRGLDGGGYILYGKEGGLDVGDILYGKVGGGGRNEQVCLNGSTILRNLMGFSTL